MFCEHLHRIRVASKKTQQQLAHHLNISPQSVSKWEKGLSLPSIDFLPLIAEFFECSVNAFFSVFELELYENFTSPTKEDILELMYLVCFHNDNKDNICYTNSGEESKIPFESLFVPALYKYLKSTEIISFSSIQKNLKVGYALASDIVNALFNMGIVELSNKKTIVLNQNKIDLLLPYIENK